MTSDPPEGTRDLSRREFLRRTGWIAGGLWAAPLLGACETDAPPPAPAASSAPLGEGDLPFSVWRALRDAIRSSPDHLIRRADRLVEAGDADAIVRFVQEEIRTFPGGLQNFGHPPTAVRWGTRATLRCGAGTPREKADLLVELLERAGMSAQLALDPVTLGPEHGRAILARDITRAFEPELTPADVERWRGLMGIGDDAGVHPIDEEGGASRDLADELFALLPDDQVSVTARGFDLRVGTLPVVRIGSGSQPQTVDVCLPSPERDTGAGAGQILELDSPSSGLLEVDVRFEFATVDAPEERTVLVQRRWTADELVGRQVVAKLLTGLALEEQVVASYNDVRSFVPALWVQGEGLDDETADELAVLGEPVTIEGTKLAVDGDTVTIDGIELAPPGTARVEQVDELRLELESTHFPELRAAVWATDPDGEPVEGLAAGDFQIEDEGDGVGFAMASNRPSPKVMILVDQSGSMPDQWLGEPAEQLVLRLQDDIRARFPAAVVQHQKTDSRLWDWLVRAAARDATLIVYATDGHVEGDLSEADARVLEEGPPAVILSVYSDLFEIFDELAAATGGVVVPVDDPDESRGAVLDFLEQEIEVPPYRFRFAASGEEPTTRTVRISTSDGQVRTTATYEVPAAEHRTVPNRICGLYLTVSVEGEGRTPRSVTRTLGGYDERHLGSPVTTEHVRDAHGAVFGSYLLHVEAADPPLSVWLDDLISSRLTLETLVGALARPDDTDLLEAMEQTPRSVPPDVYTLTGPLGGSGGDEPLVYQDGLRVVMHSLVPTFGTDHVERRIDVLPTAVYATALEDRVEAFRHTMRATARIAVGESELYETSTRSLLEDGDLRLAGSAQDIEGTAEDVGAYRRWEYLLRHPATGPVGYRLAPADGGALAVWDVDRDTGALLGLLADGRGGGNAERAIQEQLQAFNDVMTTYDLLFEAIGNVPGMTLSPALPVVAQYGKALVKLYAAVTFVLINMDPSGLDEMVREALLEFACEVNKQVFIGVFTHGYAPAEQAASLFGSLSGLLGLFYTDDPFSC